MNTYATSGQLRHFGLREKAWLVTDDREGRPRAPAGAVSRLSLDIATDAFLFLDELAEYRAAMLEIQVEGVAESDTTNTRISKRPSRKSIAEVAIEDAVEKFRAELRAMYAEVGHWPGPVPEDKKKLPAYREKMRDYVRRVLAWEAKHQLKVAK